MNQTQLPSPPNETLGHRAFIRFGGVKGIFLTLYLWIIFSTDVYLSALEDSVKAGLYILILLGAAVAAPFLLWLIGKLRIRLRSPLDTRLKKCLWLGGFLLIALGISLLRFAAYNPGGFSADSITQYKQAITGEYNNWHPVLHTILGFWLPLTLTGGWVGSIVLFQLLAFSGAVAYACYVILRHSNIPYAVLSLLFIMLNPVTGSVAMFPWKDTPFATAAVLIAAYAANTYFTGGEWLRRSKLNVAAAVTVLVLASVFRHNGLLFTVPMLIALLLYLSRKAAVIMGACFLAAIVLIEGPFYALLNVERPDNRKTEVLGLPMSVIGEVAAKNPDAMSDDMREFVYKVAPEYYWSGYYKDYFNSIKFFPETDYSKVDEEGIFKVLGYMFYSFGHDAKDAVHSLIALTDMVYTVTGDVTWRGETYPGIIKNDYGVTSAYNADCYSLVKFVDGKLDAWFGHIFWYIGTMNLVLIVCVLAKLRFRVKKEWKRILMACSMLAYNFGTMLLLSGEDFRIFFYSFVVTPVLLLIVLRDPPKAADAPAEKAEPAKKAKSAPAFLPKRMKHTKE